MAVVKTWEINTREHGFGAPRPQSRKEKVAKSESLRGGLPACPQPFGADYSPDFVRASVGGVAGAESPLT